MRSLERKIVLITGGSKGLGFSIAKHLIKEKSQIVICARDEGELQIASEEINKSGGNAHTMVCDVAIKEDVENLIKGVIQKFGQIDIVINNAGVIMVGAMESYTYKEYEDAMNIMYWGIVNTTTSVLPYMKERQGGQIINITSIGGKVSIPHMLPYVSAKFAAVGYSRGCTAELRKDKIYVSTIVPGLMRTGSYVNALFQEKNKKEFKLFSMMANAPIITISADKAARLTIRAMKKRNALKVLGLPAKVLMTLDFLFPETMNRFFGMVSRFLPAREEVTNFVPGETIRKGFKNSEVPGFEQIGRHEREKHQPQLH